MKKILLLGLILLGIGIPIAAMDKDATEARDELVGFLNKFNDAIKMAKWTEAIEEVGALDALFDVHKDEKYWGTVAQALKENITNANFDTEYIDLLRDKAQMLQALAKYDAALKIRNFQEASSQVDTIETLYNLLEKNPNWPILAKELGTIRKAAFDEAYLDKLAADLKTASSSSSSSSAQPEEPKKKVHTSGRPPQPPKRPEEPSVPKPAPAPAAAAAPFTDQAQLDLVVTALGTVYKNAEIAATTNLKSKAKAALINLSDQIKPVIGQVEGASTTFKRAKTSKLTLAAQKQLEAISNAIPHLKNAVTVIDKAAAAAA